MGPWILNEKYIRREKMNPVVLTFLGVSGPYPGSDDLPSVLLTYGRTNILLDAGEGIQSKLLKVGKSVTSINAVLITHMHGDHVLGLVPLIQSRSLAGSTTPLYLVGPEGLYEYLICSFKNLYFEPGYKTGVFEVSPQAEEGISKEVEIVDLVNALPTQPAGDTPLLKFSISKNSLLRLGNDVYVKPFEVKHSITVLAYRIDIKSRLEGRNVSICYVTDTLPLEETVKECYGVNVLIHDSTFASDLNDKALEYKHSTSIKAAEIALKSHAEMLVLYHISPRYKDKLKLLSEARSLFEHTYIVEKYWKLYIKG